MDARVKIAAFLIYLIVLFSLKNLLSVMGMLILCLILFPVAKVPAKVTLRNFKPIVPIVIITVIINLLLIKQGDILVSFWKINLYREGIRYTLMLIIRLFAVISASSLVSYTTSPLELTSAIEFYLSPLRLIGINTNEIAMMLKIGRAHV